MSKQAVLIAGTVLLCTAVQAVTDAEFEAKRRTILAKPRRMMTDNDGNDFVYYRRTREVSEKAFVDSRIGYVARTRCETMIYCPWSAGFGNFSLFGIGDTYTNACPYLDTYNPIFEFAKIGKDPLQMAVDFCRRENREIFLGIRMNDTHDEGIDKLFPDWKRNHPDCLFGTKAKKPPRCAWSAVDFGRPEVRDRMKDFMRKFFARYDLDGVEYDFFRHCQLFKSVAWATDVESARASAAQLDVMSRFMRDLREIADEEGRRRGKPLVVAIRVPDSFDYCRAVGIDLERWLKEKSVDVVIGGGYFQLNPWRETAKRVHALGGKFLVSLDESRIGWNKDFYKFGYLPGRSGRSFDAARIAAATAEGADGVCFFNCQGGSLVSSGTVDPDATEGLAKSYFAVERGSGGYTPDSWIFSGLRFSNIVPLDPARPAVIYQSMTFPFEIVIGDDFSAPAARQATPRVTARMLLDTPQQVKDLRLRVNDRTLPPCTFASGNTTNGTYSVAIPVADLKCGANRFELVVPFNLNGRNWVRFVDFRVDVNY